ncbi:MerR family transcriptional regulator [Paucisalibacillus sp. EB02]|uniref:MerR family transcriptional regulator n=1 Tax=Paucisalibacillus sp. EB02 TaxID=1347087 RepID=UPI0004B44A0E|nr:MerR family transcriptional regulator [Paucisalibacillus sp. EB02]
MKINEAAKFLSTTPKTLRFYESKGLITPEKDENNQYRYYTEHDLYRISTILALREIGVSVEEIKTLLNNPNLSMNQYLDIQRSALFEQWIEMRDMIETIDQMIESGNNSIENIHQLANHLKNLKEIRSKWQDRWNFDDQALDYDENIKKEGHIFNVHEGYDEALATVEELVNVEAGDIVLDIGIGTGNLGSRFLKGEVHVIGVDQSERMLKVCKEKHPKIETRKGHFLALPLLDHSVDSIVSSYALHHLPDEEKVLALMEMTRVLKNNGQICIADLMFEDQSHRKKVIESYQQAGKHIAIEVIEDEYFADKALLVNWLRENGFQIETIQFNDILGLVYARNY